MKSIRSQRAGYAFLLTLFLGGCSMAQTVKTSERIVFLGSSSTDGFSYPLLVQQALRDAGKPVPLCINAGAGGDTLKAMAARVERDVLAYAPTMVFLQGAVNDALRNVPLEEAEAALRAICGAMKARQIPLFIMTSNRLGASKGEEERRLRERFDPLLRELAREYALAIVDVRAGQEAAADTGAVVIEADHIHPNFEGHRRIARAVLDALGHAEVAVPETMDVKMAPGVVLEWKIKARAEADAKPLAAADAAALQPDAAWKTLVLPQPARQDHWWRDQIRAQGYALSLDELAGKAKRYVGYAKVTSAAARQAFLNTGAGLEAVWLNGERVYARGAEWHGFHAGRDRLPVALRRGENVIVIEAANEFFLSITDTREW